MELAFRILGAVSPVIAVITFIIGQKNGLKKNSYEEGVKDANIKNALDNLANTIEGYAKNSVQNVEFAEWKNRVKVLENHVFNGGGHDGT